MKNLKNQCKKALKNSSLGYTRPQELADLRFGPSLAVFTVNYSVSDLGSYVVCAPYFTENDLLADLMVCQTDTVSLSIG